MYVAAKGGEAAIANAQAELARARRGDPRLPPLSVDQIREQLALSVARVMAEGALYDPELAALAIKQARGDLVEAIFLIRAYRTTLPRLGASVPLDTGAMDCDRRISAIYKDLPGGQVLGPTFDYSHRLLDFSLLAEAGLGDDLAPAPEGEGSAAPDGPDRPGQAAQPDGGAQVGPAAYRPPHAMAHLDREGLIERVGDRCPVPGPAGTADDRMDGRCAGGDGARDGAGRAPGTGEDTAEAAAADHPPVGDAPPDLTRAPLDLPASRPLRLQALARADEGFLLSLAYSTQRGYGRNHAFVGELRIGECPVEMDIPELGLRVVIGSVVLSECETVNQFAGSRRVPAQFTRGYGLVFGQNERKALSMALVERALRWRDLGESPAAGAPAQDEEFVLAHADNVQATGFLEHIKLPHYVDFQAEAELVRGLRRAAAREAAEDGDDAAAGDDAGGGGGEMSPAARRAADGAGPVPDGSWPGHGEGRDGGV